LRGFVGCCHLGWWCSECGEGHRHSCAARRLTRSGRMVPQATGRNPASELLLTSMYCTLLNAPHLRQQGQQQRPRRRHGVGAGGRVRAVGKQVGAGGQRPAPHGWSRAAGAAQLAPPGSPPPLPRQPTPGVAGPPTGPVSLGAGKRRPPPTAHHPGTAPPRRPPVGQGAGQSVLCRVDSREGGAAGELLWQGAAQLVVAEVEHLRQGPGPAGWAGRAGQQLWPGAAAACRMGPAPGTERTGRASKLWRAPVAPRRSWAWGRSGQLGGYTGAGGAPGAARAESSRAPGAAAHLQAGPVAPGGYVAVELVVGE
jgi:hypothetical protein